MSRYLITLTPAGRFFFGGDMTFKVGDDKGYNEKFSSYIIESGRMPQQTSLLGMLRFLILSNNCDVFDRNLQKITDTKEAGRIIGRQSFSVSADNTENDFGQIQSLSPCFIQHRLGSEGPWMMLEPSRLDKDLNITFDYLEANYNGMTINVPVVMKDNKPFSSKCRLSYGFEGKERFFSEEEIFIKDQRIGINRTLKGQTEEDALYKQIGYRFKDDAFRFALVADVVDIDLKLYDGQLVSVGGDNTNFIIGISDYSGSDADEIEGDTIMLLSPSYVEEMAADFAVTEVIPFRFIQTRVEVSDYNVLHSRTRSKKFNLFKQGSVFYFKDNEACGAFAEKLRKYKDFYQIGYNHYKIINR